MHQTQLYNLGINDIYSQLEEWYSDDNDKTPFDFEPKGYIEQLISDCVIEYLKYFEDWGKSIDEVCK